MQGERAACKSVACMVNLRQLCRHRDAGLPGSREWQRAGMWCTHHGASPAPEARGSAATNKVRGLYARHDGMFDFLPAVFMPVHTSWSVTEMCARRASSRTSGGATPPPLLPPLLRHCSRAAGCARAAGRMCCADREAGKQRRVAERASRALMLPPERTMSSFSQCTQLGGGSGTLPLSAATLSLPR